MKKCSLKKHEMAESKAFEKKEHTLKKNHKVPKLTPKNSHKAKGKAKIAKVMGEFKNKTLKIGKSNKKITNRKQAVAVALSEARKASRK